MRLISPGRSWKTASLYLFCILFIGIWWGLSFTESPRPLLPTPPSRPSPKIDFSFSRGELLQALQGDFVLMGRMILHWDVEAQVNGRLRLDPQKVLRAHYLAKTIPLSPPAKVFKVIPQTYVSAGILLAIATPNHIVALPRGLREQTALYPPSLTQKIPLDIDQYTTEKLFLTHPDFAIVSLDYTHPAALLALINQGIPIHATSQCETFEDILQEIQTLGTLTGQTAEAELLMLFMEAAFLKLDQIPKNKSQTLFLSYYEHFYLPRISNITGALVLRAGLPLPKVNPLELKEYLLNADPETLVISVPSTINLLPILQKDAGYSQLRAVREGNVRIVNDDLFQTPTHFSVLAYYDLIEALRP